MNNFWNFNIGEVGLLVIGAAYVVTYWSKGGNQATTEVITALKEQHEINVKRISQLTQQVGELTGQLQEKDKRISLLETMVKTTPEQQQYMSEMRKFTEGVAAYMDSSTKTLGEISVFMHSVNTKLSEVPS